MFTKPLIYLSLALVFGSLGKLRAGTIEIVGQGEASSAPERYTIDLTVTSICYETTKDAKSENSTIANQLVAIANKYSKTSEDKINTYPGGFVRNTEYIPEGTGHSKILCENGWRTWNTIRLQLHDIYSLPDLQDELVVFLEPIESINPSKKQQTFIQLGSPQFGLKEENLNKLRKQAQHAALEDAKAQLQNFDDNCHFKSIKLRSLAPPSLNTFVRFGAKSSSTPESSTPIIPEEITVTATWNFSWEFENAPGCFN